MNWYPSKRLGLLSGLVLLTLLVGAEGSLLRSLLGAPIDFWLYLRALIFVAALPLVAFLAYAYYGLAKLAYRVERNGVQIRWGAVVDLVPRDEIVEIVPFAALSKRLGDGWGWPGYRIGDVQVEGLGRVRLYTTRPPEQSLAVRTRNRTYIISPANVEGFLADYRTRRKLGPIVHWTEGRRLPGLLNLSIWRDRLAGELALLGLVLNLALFGYLAARYPGLPPRLTLSYDLQGMADRIGGRSELLALPALGLAMLVVNAALAVWLHRKERVLALLLLSNGPVVQALLWLAAVRLAG